MADFTDNVAGQAIDITFAGDTDWQSAITSVYADGAVLSPDQYSISEGKLTIKAGVKPFGESNSDTGNRLQPMQCKARK